LLIVHPDYEIAHNLVRLLLHLGLQMLLFAFVLLHHDFELGYLLLVFFLSPIQLLYIVQVQLLSLHTAHLLPEAKGFVGKLLVN